MLRVMTVNLLNGAGSPATLERVLDEHRPHVLGAQELSANQSEVLERHFAYGVSKPRTDNEGSALMSQLEIAVSLLPLAHRDGLVGTVDVDGSEVEVITMHLANPIDGPFGTFGERRRQVAGVVPRLTGPGHRVLMGDLNSTPAWPAYRLLTRHVDDAVAIWAAGAGVKPRRTWGWRPGWPAMLRIDHVLTSGLEATRVAVERVDGSDHRALIVDLEIDG